MDTLLLPCAIPSKLIFQFYYRVTVPDEELLSISKSWMVATLYDAMFVVGTATLASYFLSFFFWVVGCRRISRTVQWGGLDHNISADSQGSSFRPRHRVI